MTTLSNDNVLHSEPTQDDLFVEQLLIHEDKPDGVEIAARLAGFSSLENSGAIYSPRVIADYHFNRPEIQAALRIARKFKRPARHSGEPTADSIYAAMDVVFERSLATNNAAGAVAAVKLSAQVAGLLKENVVHTHKLDLTTLSDSQLAAIATRKPKTIEADYADVTPASNAGLGALEYSPKNN